MLYLPFLLHPLQLIIKILIIILIIIKINFKFTRILFKDMFCVKAKLMGTTQLTDELFARVTPKHVFKKYSMTCEFKNYFDNIVITKLGKYNDNSNKNMRNLIGTF